MELKDPLGDLWAASVEENVERLKNYLSQTKPPFFATVGDFVTTHILNAGIHPEIAVVDHKIMRRDVDPVEFHCDHLEAKNPPGTVTKQSQEALYSALEYDNGFRLVVDGEEDLLVLPLMAMLPEGSVIVYGQPREGMVVITLTEEKRNWARDFLATMEHA